MPFCSRCISIYIVYLEHRRRILKMGLYLCLLNWFCGQQNFRGIQAINWHHIFPSINQKGHIHDWWCGHRYRDFNYVPMTWWCHSISHDMEKSLGTLSAKVLHSFQTLVFKSVIIKSQYKHASQNSPAKYNHIFPPRCVECLQTEAGPQ